MFLIYKINNFCCGASATLFLKYYVELKILIKCNSLFLLTNYLIKIDIMKINIFS